MTRRKGALATRDRTEGWGSCGEARAFRCVWDEPVECRGGEASYICKLVPSQVEPLALAASTVNSEPHASLPYKNTLLIQTNPPKILQ